jgi:hypothetical protein
MLVAGRPARQSGAVTAADVPDLAAERAEVLAHVAGSAISTRPPEVQAAGPLRPLPAALEAKLADRPRALEPASGGVVPRIGALLRRDPRRLTAADRRAIAAARRWESHQPWTGPLASCAERGLVLAAARAAERIAGSPAWRSGRIDDARVRLDLGAELDQIDDQAFRIAQARQAAGEVAVGAVPSGGPPAVAAAWETTLTRVAALTAYANRISGLEQRRRADQAALGDPVGESDLLAGAARDEFAVNDLVGLTYFLGGGELGINLGPMEP